MFTAELMHLKQHLWHCSTPSAMGEDYAQVSGVQPSDPGDRVIH